MLGIQAPVIADSFDAETFFTELKIHGASMKLPAPSWQKRANTKTETETREHDGGIKFHYRICTERQKLRRIEAAFCRVCTAVTATHARAIHGPIRRRLAAGLR